MLDGDMGSRKLLLLAQVPSQAEGERTAESLNKI